MKNTGALSTIADTSVPYNKIVINPNDGYDLDLLSKDYLIKAYAGVSLDDFATGEGMVFVGSVVLENSCKLGTVVLNRKTLEQIGRPSKVALYYEDGRLLIQNI